MLLAIGNDGQFVRFCEAVDQPQWATDPRFATNTLRVENRTALVPAVEAITLQRTTAQWIALLEHKAVPCGPINSVGQAFADEQVIARGLKLNQPLALETIKYTAITSIATVASPLRLMDTPAVVCRPPPALGEHTDEVLAGLGLDPAAIAALRHQSVV
jgi:formyl-CoA transferase